MKKKNILLISIISLITIIAIVAVFFIINSKNNKDDNQKENTENNSKTSSAFLDGYRIIYDFNEVPEDFLNGDDLGFGMPNKEIFEARIKNSIGEQFGSLTPPKTQYDIYVELNDTPYVFTINKGGWLYLRGAYPISEDSNISLYSLDNYLVLNEIKLYMQSTKKMKLYGDNPEKLKEEDGWGQWDSNGWTVYTNSNKETNYACLFYFLDDELVMSTKLYKSSTDATEYMKEEDFKEYIEKFTNSVYFTKMTEPTEEKIVVNDLPQRISIGEKGTLELLKDTYLTGWYITTEKDENKNKMPVNLITLEKNDGSKKYQIVEYKEDVTIENLKKADSLSTYTTYITKNGMPVEIGYNKVFERYDDFLIVIDNRCYDITIKSSEINSLEDMQNEVEDMLTNMLTIQ